MSKLCRFILYGLNQDVCRRWDILRSFMKLRSTTDRRTRDLISSLKESSDVRSTILWWHSITLVPLLLSRTRRSGVDGLA